MRQATNIELIDKALNDDKKAFNTLIERHYAYCLNKAGRMVNDRELAKDLIQEAFLEAYFNLSKLNDKNSFKPWLGGIVHNVCNNYIRKNCKKYASLKNYFDEQQSAESNADGKIVELVLQAVKTLDVSFEAIVYAFYYEGKTISEICHEQTITPALAKVRLHRARIELKAILLEKPEMKDYQQYFKNKKIMKKVEIIDLILKEKEKTEYCVVVLYSEELSRVLPIIIGKFEGQAMFLALKNINTSRPLTHNILAEMMRTNGLKPESVNITDIVDGVFFAVLKVNKGHDIKEYDIRPSDAIPIALMFDIPIQASVKVLDKGYLVPEKYKNMVAKENGLKHFYKLHETFLAELDARRKSLSSHKSENEIQEEIEKLMSFVFEEAENEV